MNCCSHPRSRFERGNCSWCYGASEECHDCGTQLEQWHDDHCPRNSNPPTSKQLVGTGSWRSWTPEIRQQLGRVASQLSGLYVISRPRGSWEFSVWLTEDATNESRAMARELVFEEVGQ